MKVRGTVRQDIEISKYEQSVITVNTLKEIYGLVDRQLIGEELHDTIHRRDCDRNEGFVAIATEEQKVVFNLIDKIHKWGTTK